MDDVDLVAAEFGWSKIKAARVVALLKGFRGNAGPRKPGGRKAKRKRLSRGLSGGRHE